jgi:hypothetical protein
MQVPFTSEQFFSVFAQYNAAVWPVPILLNALAIIAVVAITRPRPWSGAAVSLILALLWGWNALAYHLAFFAAINPLAYAFAALSLIGAIVFVWQGLIRQRLRFGRVSGLPAATGAALILFALVIYPLWSWAAGHAYPVMPTFGLPCPTTIFTVGVLAFMIKPYPRSVFVVPVLWSAIGAQAAFLLGVPQDSGLIVAAVVGLVLLVKSGSA